MAIRILASLLFIFMFSLNCKINSAKDILLTQYPTIMAHDAASGEIVEERDHILSDWTKTQSGGIVSQLNCGARSFDYRPLSKNGQIYAHHGGVTIYKLMEDTLKEIIHWTTINRGEFVILYISHYAGDDDCQENVEQLLVQYNIAFIKDCSQLFDFTYQQAMTLTANNRILGIFDCTEENYDEHINCYGKDFVCYDSWPSSTTDIPFKNLEDHLLSVTNEPSKEYNTMWMAQAHWQQTAATISLGTLHNSSIVSDVFRSEINKNYLYNKVITHAYKQLNFLELDEVCDGGNAIYNALQEVYITPQLKH
jgi:hypothetical protein